MLANLAETQLGCYMSSVPKYLLLCQKMCNVIIVIKHGAVYT